MNVAGAVVLVTGANRGIGRAMVERLVASGAKRVYAASRSEEGVPSHANVSHVRLDITSPADVKLATERCSDVNVLVNNAGVELGGSLIGAASEAGAEREMSVNYLGTLRMCRAFAPVLARNGGGAIVNVLSILARANMPAVGSYSASKAAALSMTQGVRAELARQGTLVVALMPAFVDTDMTAHVKAPKITPEQVAETAIRGLEDGQEEVYPGQAAQIAAQIDADHRAVERQFAAMFASK